MPYALFLPEWGVYVGTIDPEHKTFRATFEPDRACMLPDGPLHWPDRGAAPNAVDGARRRRTVMNTALQTPGPWRAIEWSCRAVTTVVAVVDGQQVVIAECAGHGRYAVESQPDAYLIAAAPDLLALAQRLEPWLAGHEKLETDAGTRQYDSQFLIDLRAAIAKATGRVA